MKFKLNTVFVILAGAALLTACTLGPVPAATLTPTALPSATVTASPQPSATPLPSATPTTQPSATSQPSQTPIPLAHGALVTLRMFDTSSGWAVDDQGKVYRTTTGIPAWQDVTPPGAPVQSDPNLAAFIPVSFFLDSSHAWLAYYYNNANLVLYTLDGGATWQQSQALPTSSSGEPSGAISLFFIDAQTGWMWAQIYPGMFHVYADLYATTDGGATWTLRYDSFAVETSSGGAMRGAYSLSFGTRIFTFQDSLKGWAGTGSLYATADGGTTWTLAADETGVQAGQIVWNLPTSLPFVKDPYWYFGAPLFTSAQDGVLPVFLFEAGVVYNPPGDQFSGLPVAAFLVWTHDGGATWTFERAPALLGTATLLDAQTAWYLGKDSADPTAPASLFISTDGGATWTALQTSIALPLGTVLQFLNAQNGFASPPDLPARTFFAGFDTAQTGAYLFATTDGGTTWTP